MADWKVIFHPAFQAECEEMAPSVQDALFAHAELLEKLGPILGRPWADALQGSRHANLKELRFNAADGVWRVAYAFDPERRAVLLVAGNKSGVSSSRFYKRLLAKADARFDEHLQSMGQ